MAERRSTYVFDRERDYEEAKSHLYRKMYGDYSNDDCIHFYGSWGSECWRIDIYSDCSDAPLVADIIREHHGKFYDL